MLQTAFGNITKGTFPHVLRDCGEAGIHVHFGVRIESCAVRPGKGENGLRRKAPREQERASGSGFYKLIDYWRPNEGLPLIRQNPPYDQYQATS